MKWKLWLLGAFISLFYSALVAGAGLVADMHWKGVIAVFCAACLTHFGAYLQKHPVESISFDSDPAAFRKSVEKAVEVEKEKEKENQ